MFGQPACYVLIGRREAHPAILFVGGQNDSAGLGCSSPAVSCTDHGDMWLIPLLFSVDARLVVP